MESNGVIGLHDNSNIMQYLSIDELYHLYSALMTIMWMVPVYNAPTNDTVNNIFSPPAWGKLIIAAKLQLLDEAKWVKDTNRQKKHWWLIYSYGYRELYTTVSDSTSIFYDNALPLQVTKAPSGKRNLQRRKLIL
jgi:hypothetical protein